MFQYDGFDEYGYIYYPYTCLKDNAKCKLHFFLHGCMGTAALLGEITIRNIGLMEWAATNDIIVVFPQNKYNYGSNLFCCWSHQDYSLPDENYFNNLGIQNAAFKRMIDRLTSERDTSAYNYDGWRTFFSFTPFEGHNMAD